MNYEYKKLKMIDSSNIIQNKNRGVLSICRFNKPYQEMIFYDIDCFCGCITLYFKVCKCSEIINNLDTNNNASLLISNKSNNTIETVELEGTLEKIEEEENCCCQKKKDCYVTLRFDIQKVDGKRYYKC